MFVLQAKKLTMDEYAMNHPAGRIGKRLILKVGDIMSTGKNLPTSSADATLMSELVKLSSMGCGCLLLVDAAGKLEGVLPTGGQCSWPAITCQHFTINFGLFPCATLGSTISLTSLYSN